jgi:hypothetical protein
MQDSSNFKFPLLHRATNFKSFELFFASYALSEVELVGLFQILNRTARTRDFKLDCVVRQVQSRNFGFRIEMQDSSNFKFPLFSMRF